MLFFVTESMSLYLKIFRFLTIFEKKLFRLSAISDSVFKILPFSITLILCLMRDMPQTKGFIDFQNSLVSIKFFMFTLSYPVLGFCKEMHSNSFAYYKEFYFLPLSFSENYCEVWISSSFL